jgi:hypothetical protein
VDLRPKTAPATAPPTSAPTAEARLDALLAGCREHVDIVVPRTDPSVRGKLRRLTRGEEEELSIELGRWRKAAIDWGTPPESRLELSSQEAVRTVAIAVRDPADPSRPLASLNDWRQADDGQIGAVYQQYLDLVDRTDVFRDHLATDERAEIEDAVRKKDVARLLSCGARKLTAWLLTSASQPAS